MQNPASDQTTIVPRARRRDILAATIYLGTAVSLLAYSRLRFGQPVLQFASAAYGLSFLVGGVLLLISSILVSAMKRFANAIALAGALLSWPLLRLLEFKGLQFSSWLTFNLPDGAQYRFAFFIARLTIVSIGLLTVATVLPVLRLLPESLNFQGVPLRRLNWPPFVITFIFVTGWYVTSVNPYQLPIYDIHRGPHPVLSLLHVQKRGLQFHEMSAAFYRDGKFYLNHDDRRLFEYRFPVSSATGLLEEQNFRRFNLLVDSLVDLQGIPVTQYSPPLAWNTDEWFVVITPRNGPKPKTLMMTTAPTNLVAWFDDVKTFPREWTREGTVKDICFGFCYNPTY